MALDITGIANVGEFYSQHYLDALLERDLKDTLRRWATEDKEKVRKAPYKALASLANTYFTCADGAYGNPDPSERLAQARSFHAGLLQALGYERKPSLEPVGESAVAPVALCEQHEGAPYLWVLEAPFAKSADDCAPFDEVMLPEQLAELATQAGGAELNTLPNTLSGSYGEWLDGELLRQDNPPRWVLLLAGADAFLIDRHKWARGQYLHFKLGVLLGRAEPEALKVVAGLLHREVLLPSSGQSLLDTLDEHSHKHAFAVSTELKFGVQRAIELIGNEALHALRAEKGQEGGPAQDGLADPKLADKLSRECIVYLYRLLFLFYVEARGKDVGVTPMDAEVYRDGYSLETLRDLELVPLHSDQARNGFFLHHSLQRLFSLVQQGFGSRPKPVPTEDLAPGAGVQIGLIHVEQSTFSLAGLRSPLFDAQRTPILSTVKLRNQVLQQVIALLSLSSEKGGNGGKSNRSRSKGRGRISYAQLGINQLGAVYEGLLSYTGFFAESTVYELRAKGEIKDPDARTYFVPETDIGRYEEEEKVRDDHGRAVCHSPGTFLFRLSGRDRETSASYYTPEVLTRCLTKYTLRERLGHRIVDQVEGKALDDSALLRADEILELTLCEPAMGSGAFLNEAVDQLADAYLEKKQAELGERIAAEDYQRERQRVKYHFVTQRCYGVDLNPLASELGKVSLWLGALQPGVEAPYLDLRLAVGNSLIGARRACYSAADLSAKKKADSWQSRVPQRLEPGQRRGKTDVYHFLVPDPAMVPFDGDKVVKSLEPEACAAIKTWRKAMLVPFTQGELATLQALCERIDSLWAEHRRERRQVLAATHQKIPLYGQPALTPLELRPKSVQECEETARKLQRPDAPGQRLQRVMDYGCALWFWPLAEVGVMPSRAQWLADVAFLLADGTDDRQLGEQGELGIAREQRLKVVQYIAAAQRFFHWELAFAEVFAPAAGSGQRVGGGMDVILGNPPWIKLEWQEAGILGDLDPELTLRKLSATRIADRRAQALAEPSARATYLTAFEASQGAQAFLNAEANYPLLKGVQTNLYKCFLTRLAEVSALAGVQGFLHPEGPFDDPKGGELRSFMFRRLALHVQFINEANLFAEIHHRTRFSMNVYGSEGRAFVSGANYFQTYGFETSMGHDGFGDIPGLKDEQSNWDLRGHRSRLVVVGEAELELFAKLYDKPGTSWREARLPVVHSREILQVLRRFAEAPRTLADLNGEFFATEHFHETNQQKDGTMARETRFPENAGEWIVSGPHFYVGTPFNKTPNEGCKHNQDYSSLDLTTLADDYLPRTNYVPACSPEEYTKRTPHWKGRPVTEFYRHAHREMVAPTGERTLVPCILPPGAAHVHTVFSLGFGDESELLNYFAMGCSLPIDFFVKSTGMGHVNKTLAGQLFLAAEGGVCQRLRARALRLTCLATHYADLWQRNWCLVAADGFAKEDRRLPGWQGLSGEWNRDCALRTPFARRQALVELDALAALALKMTVEELVLIYRVQFPVLQMYERETFYDQRGKIVFTTNRGMSDVGLTRKQWEEIQDAGPGDALPEWACDGQGPFVAPFDSCDREADMRQAYAHFAALVEADSSNVDGADDGQVN